MRLLLPLLLCLGLLLGGLGLLLGGLGLLLGGISYLLGGIVSSWCGLARSIVVCQEAALIRALSVLEAFAFWFYTTAPNVSQSRVLCGVPSLQAFSQAFLSALMVLMVVVAIGTR